MTIAELLRKLSLAELREVEQIAREEQALRRQRGARRSRHPLAARPNELQRAKARRLLAAGGHR